MKTMHLLLLAIVVVAGVGAYWAGLGLRSPAPPAPPAAAVNRIDGLAIELAALDLGEVWEENHFHRQVRIRNESTEDAFMSGSDWGVPRVRASNRRPCEFPPERRRPSPSTSTFSSEA